MNDSLPYILEWGSPETADFLLKTRIKTFIPAPRQLSDERIKQLIKEYLPKGTIVWGISAEPYIEEFEGQPQFTTLTLEQIEPWMRKTNARAHHKIYILKYSQFESNDVINKLHASKYVYIRGSWHRSFHLQSRYELLKNAHQRFSFESPFSNEQEAREYAQNTHLAELSETEGLKTPAQFMDAVQTVARRSYDHSFQVGAILAERQTDNTYRYLSSAHNEVVPYETYAMHTGFMREDNKVPPHDLNHYDTVHAETLLLLRAKKTAGMSVFINVMPCRTCARAIVACGITEVMYRLPHGNDYTDNLFKDAGVRLQKVLL